MNLTISIGLYASISKELNGTLLFPGSEKFYMCFDCFTYSRLHASFNLWAASESKCSSEAFNVVNGDVELWQIIWPEMAHRFGCKIPANQFAVEIGKDAGSVMLLAEKPLIAESAAEMGLEGRVRQSKVEQRIDLIKWSQVESEGGRREGMGHARQEAWSGEGCAREGDLGLLGICAGPRLQSRDQYE